jgi:hypothetical protein
MAPHGDSVAHDRAGHKDVCAAGNSVAALSIMLQPPRARRGGRQAVLANARSVSAAV